MALYAVAFLAYSLSHSVTALTTPFTRGASVCKSIPGDPSWPSPQSWNRLNKTVDGRLIATVPEGAVCHPGGFGALHADAAVCAALTKAWDSPVATLGKPAEVMNPWFQNGSCSPFYRTNEPCELGNYASYSVNVSTAEDIVAAIQFAHTEGVRLTILNTGHDFLGKSTGKGALSIWTHNLRGLDIITNYTSNDYAGAALKIGAGLTGGEVLLHISTSGYRVVSGDCATVGISGGYSSGGGHGLLNGAYGLAADNVLEWEVVTADGRHLTASPQQNADLYWALTGGGAGTYAVVVSMTVRLHRDGPLGAATLGFNASASPSNASYEAALDAWWRFLPSLVDTGASPAFNFYDGGFLVFNTTAPDQTADDLARLYQPYLKQLSDLSVPYTFATYTAPSYAQHFDHMYGPLPVGPYLGSPLFNSRLIPSITATTPTPLTQAMVEAMRIDPHGANWQFGCVGLNVSEARIHHPDNGVAPYWRDALALCLEFSNYNWTVPESVMVARRRVLADVIHPAIEAATPGSGAYLNEADPLVYPASDTKKWQDAFYGTNYKRLRTVKDTWDPTGVFYAFTAVGSEDWVEDTEGRLCKA